MSDLLVPKETREKPNPRSRTPPTPAVEDAILDWDVRIEPSPQRRRGTIRVELKFMGRGRPILVSDPSID